MLAPVGWVTHLAQVYGAIWAARQPINTTLKSSAEVEYSTLLPPIYGFQKQSFDAAVIDVAMDHLSGIRPLCQQQRLCR